MEKVIKVTESELAEAKPAPATGVLDPTFNSLKVDPMKTKKKSFKPVYAILGVVVLLLGVSTGYVAAKGLPGSLQSEKAKVAITPATEDSKEAGIADESTLANLTEAEGILVEGGIDGEGTHYLDRNAGKDKYVYLTSTTINLQSFVGKKVQVKGETVSGKKAGWLMDIVKVKVLE